jgi:hypothetical protein
MKEDHGGLWALNVLFNSREIVFYSAKTQVAGPGWAYMTEAEMPGRARKETL